MIHLCKRSRSVASNLMFERIYKKISIEQKYLVNAAIQSPLDVCVTENRHALPLKEERLEEEK